MSCHCSKLRSLLLAAAALACASASLAQQYVFTNDNITSANSTTVLSVDTTGSLKVLQTYATGGMGSGGGSDYASQPIVAAETSANWCLFVSNARSSSIAAFRIDLMNGHLATVSGSPSSDGASRQQMAGISRAVGNGKLLFAANSESDSISVMKISSTCGLSLVGTVGLSYAPVALKVTPNGDYLIASYLGPVDSFRINYNTNSITELGPFQSQGATAGIDIRCDGTRAFFGDASASTEVEVFAINSDGQLSEVSKFTDPNGSNSNNVLLSADQNKLYVTNNQSNQITVLSVSTSAHLTFDSITTLHKPGEYALGLATNRGGNLLLVSEVNDPESIGVLAAKGNSLIEVPNSPFSVVNNDRAFGGLIFLPTNSCP